MKLAAVVVFHQRGGIANAVVGQMLSHTYFGTVFWRRPDMGIKNCLVYPINNSVGCESRINEQVDQIGRRHVGDVLDVFFLEPSFMPDINPSKSRNGNCVSRLGTMIEPTRLIPDWITCHATRGNTPM